MHANFGTDKALPSALTSHRPTPSQFCYFPYRRRRASGAIRVPPRAGASSGADRRPARAPAMPISTCPQRGSAAPVTWRGFNVAAESCSPASLWACFYRKFRMPPLRATIGSIVVRCRPKSSETLRFDDRFTTTCEFGIVRARLGESSGQALRISGLLSENLDASQPVYGISRAESFNPNRIKAAHFLVAWGSEFARHRIDRPRCLKCR